MDPTQLDDVAKVGNAVRFWGNTLVMADGSLTLTQYLARWRQALDYIHSLGLYVYPCAGDLGHWGSYTWVQSTQTYAELAQLLASYPNVIGVDIVNEARSLNHDPGPFSYHQPEPAEVLLPELGNIVRATGLPITYSRRSGMPAGGVSITSRTISATSSISRLLPPWAHRLAHRTPPITSHGEMADG